MAYPLLAVHGAVGGVGTSIVALSLSAALVRAGVPTALVDVSGHAPLDVVAGQEHQVGLRWSDLGLLRGAVEGGALLERLPSLDGVAILSRGPSLVMPSPDQVSAVLHGLGQTGVVVVDCGPPATPATEVVALLASRWLMVTRPDPGGAVAASVHGEWWRGHCPEGWLALTGGPRGAAVELARRCSLQLLGVIPQQEQVRRAVARGASPAAVRVMASFADKAAELLMDGSER